MKKLFFLSLAITMFCSGSYVRSEQVVTPAIECQSTEYKEKVTRFFDRLSKGELSQEEKERYGAKIKRLFWGTLSILVRKVFWDTRSEEFSDLMDEVLNCQGSLDFLNDAGKRIADGLEEAKKRAEEEKKAQQKSSFEKWSKKERYSKKIDSSSSTIICTNNVCTKCDENGCIKL